MVRIETTRLSCHPERANVGTVLVHEGQEFLILAVPDEPPPVIDQDGQPSQVYVEVAPLRKPEITESYQRATTALRNYVEVAKTQGTRSAALKDIEDLEDILWDLRDWAEGSEGEPPYPDPHEEFERAYHAPENQRQHKCQGCGCTFGAYKGRGELTYCDACADRIEQGWDPD